jgi:hypothetical protein
MSSFNKLNDDCLVHLRHFSPKIGILSHHIQDVCERDIDSILKQLVAYIRGVTSSTSLSELRAIYSNFTSMQPILPPSNKYMRYLNESFTNNVLIKKTTQEDLTSDIYNTMVNDKQIAWMAALYRDIIICICDKYFEFVGIGLGKAADPPYPPNFELMRKEMGDALEEIHTNIHVVKGMFGAVFFQEASNTRDYIVKIKEGNISRDTHDKLFAVIKNTCSTPTTCTRDERAYSVFTVAQ